MEVVFPMRGIRPQFNKPSDEVPLTITSLKKPSDLYYGTADAHRFYEIIWVEQGVGKLSIDFDDYDLSKHSVVVVRPGQSRSFRKWEQLKGGRLLFAETL